MDHKGTTTIETERLILRRFEPSDAECMFKNWASDSEVVKYLPWKRYESVESSKKYISSQISEYSNKAHYNWAICSKTTSEPIGNISASCTREDIGLMQVGYCLGRVHWRQGIMSEALAAVLDYLFVEVGANCIEARHDVRNPNSGLVMQKCGMQYEGTLRQSSQNNQGICDMCYYSALAKEHKAK